jgi:cell division protein FtsL
MLSPVFPNKFSQINELFKFKIKLNKSGVAYIAVCLFCVALFQVAVKNNNRQKFLYLQHELQRHDKLVRERDRLLLAKSKLLAQHRVYRVAVHDLKMNVPKNVEFISDNK